MRFTGFRSPFLFLLLQCLVVVLILVAVPFAPPATGRMLLIPLDAQAQRLAPVALNNGALLIDRGPIPGSLVVNGNRARLAAALGAVLIVAAPQGGCSRPGESA